MNLEALQVYLTVVKHGSFAAAAADLSISRATAAKRVDELEAAAGIALLVRMPTGIVPTSAGTELAERGKHIIGQATALLTASRRVGATPTGLVRLLTTIGAPVALSAIAFDAALTRWPDLRIETRYVEDPLAVLVGGAELALVFDLEIPPGPWEVQPLLPVPDRLVASAKYLAAHPPIRVPEDLAAHRLILWHGPNEPADHLPLLDGGRFPVTPTLVTNREDVAQQMAAQGMGVALVPRPRMPPPGVPPVDDVLPAVVGRSRWARLVVPHGVSSLPRVRVMIDTAVSLTAPLR